MTIARSIALMLLIASPTLTSTVTAARADVTVDIVFHSTIAPPPLPVYDQPPIPGDDYIWTPGYWAWDDVSYDYYWVPGAWVEAPEPGLLWTPGYWACTDNVYVFHQGYWGRHIGFYGGVVYGFGYTGFGYEGGYWRGRNFFYNTTVNNIHNTNIHITNVYQKNVIINRTTINRISYNGPGGINARPTPQQLAASARRIQPTPVQLAHRQEAHATPALFFKKNNGAPPAHLLARPAQPLTPRPTGDLRPQQMPPRPNPQGNNAMARPEPGHPIAPQAYAPHSTPQRRDMHMQATGPAIRHEPQFHQMAVRHAPVAPQQMHHAPRIDRSEPVRHAALQRPMVQHAPRPAFHPQSHHNPAPRHCRPGEHC